MGWAQRALIEEGVLVGPVVEDWDPLAAMYEVAERSPSQRAIAIMEAAVVVADQMDRPDQRERGIQLVAAALRGLAGIEELKSDRLFQTYLHNIAKHGSVISLQAEPQKDGGPVVDACSAIDLAMVETLLGQLKIFHDRLLERRPQPFVDDIGAANLFCFELYRRLVDRDGQAETISYFRDEYSLEVDPQELDRRRLQLRDIARIIGELNAKTDGLSDDHPTIRAAVNRVGKRARGGQGEQSKSRDLSTGRE